MITQLLNINITPVEMQVKMTPAKLTYDNTLQPTAQVHTEQGTLTMESHTVQLQIDTYQARKSIGLENSGDFSKDMAQRGVNSMNQFISDTVQEGDQMARTEDGVTIADIVKQKMLEQPELVTVFLPTCGADISFQPNSLSINYQPGSIDCQWNRMGGGKLNFTPGSCDIEILQRPDVQIDYIGDPNYVPPSANPHYETTAE